MHPIAWDAFGLPAEQVCLLACLLPVLAEYPQIADSGGAQYAIQTGTHPRETTERNINRFREQLQSLGESSRWVLQLSRALVQRVMTLTLLPGFSFDWDREFSTTDPEYYKWTQWIFLQLFKRGLAYQANIPVNWCPALGTVLANEEVIDGRSERGDHPVVRQPMRQVLLSDSHCCLPGSMLRSKLEDGLRHSPVRCYPWAGHLRDAAVSVLLQHAVLVVHACLICMPDMPQALHEDIMYGMGIPALLEL